MSASEEKNFSDVFRSCDQMSKNFGILFRRDSNLGPFSDNPEN